jgi:Spy/CpxP family protein refolding chaperone
MMTGKRFYCLSLALLLGAACAGYAQQPGPPMGPMGYHDQHGGGHSMGRGGQEGRGGWGHGGWGRGGMWWKNPEMVTKLGLTADQQKKIEDIFVQSRIQLIDLKASLEKEELVMEPLLNASPVDTAKASAQIDKIAETRAGLEKANAKMLLNIRSVLTPAQWTTLHTREPRGDMHRGPGGPGGKGGPAGPGQRGQWGHGRPGGQGAPAATTPPPAIE